LFEHDAVVALPTDDHQRQPTPAPIDRSGGLRN
jgi:hypothetical protein